MPDVKYKQLAVKPEIERDAEVFTIKPPAHSSPNYYQRGLLSLGLILLYFTLSIGLTFYQRWLLKEVGYPLTVVMYHLVVKWMLSVCVRAMIYFITGTPQLLLSFMTGLRSVCPTGVASGIDVGFSNWGLKLVTISLYTMTKSTSIIFILGFAIILGLEKKSWSLVGIVFMIASGLIMFTYEATQFNLLGFNFLLIASFAAGLRWTFAQLLMQKSKLGLHNPVDMVFHVQPWMFLSVLPFMLMFEGFEAFDFLLSLPAGQLQPTMLKVSVGATVAFAMEISEFLVVTYTSSLTLSIAGIFKEMCILVLAVRVGGDQLSPINIAGLVVCLLGISGHIIHKVAVIRSMTGSLDAPEDFSGQVLRTRSPATDGDAPLLSNQHEQASDDSDLDSNVVLSQVLKRRDQK